MAIFEIESGKAKRIRLSEFKLEKDLQSLVEQNLESIFNCRFIATEFSTGNIHSERIDTLALSELPCITCIGLGTTKGIFKLP